MLGVASQKLWKTISSLRHASKLTRRHANTSSLPQLSVRPATASTGLCGLEVRKPHDIYQLTKIVVQECQKKVSLLARYEQLEPSQIVRTLDEISDLVCKVSDPCELLSSVVSDDRISEAAQDAVRMIQETIVELNHNPMLEKATRYAHERRNKLSVEEAAVCSQLLIEFEHQGSLLPPKSHDLLEKLQSQLYEAGENFRSHTPEAETRIPISPGVAQLLPANISKKLRRSPSGPVLSSYDHYEKEWILRNCEDETTRKDVCYSERKNALIATEELLRARQAVSNHLGFPSYSHYYAWHRSLKTPESVMQFLDSLHGTLQPKIKSEIALLSQEKQRHASSSAIYAWDLEFYKTRVLKARESSRTMQPSHQGGSPTNSQMPHQAETRVSRNLEEYFTLENVMKAAQQLWSIVFGVRMELVSGVDSEVWHTTVMRADFIDEKTGEFLGKVYFDLIDRPGKSVSANFPLRLRSRLGTPSVAMLTQIQSSSSQGGTLTRGDLAKYGWRGALGLENLGKPLLVPFEDVRTFFHELGHLTQGILCRNDLQHFSGTRGLMDHIETPSQLLERFASDYRFVSLFARHYLSGEVISEEAFNDHLKRNATFAGLRTNGQLVLAALDQQLHAAPFKSSMDVLRSVNQKYAAVPYHEKDMIHAGFQHLWGYGSVYYSYLFCGVKASQLYASLFSNDPLSPSAGKLYRDEFLALGGLGDPAEIMKAITGKSVDPSYFVQDICEGKL